MFFVNLKLLNLVVTRFIDVVSPEEIYAHTLCNKSVHDKSANCKSET